MSTDISMRLKNIPISRKLSFGFGAVLLIVTLSATFVAYHVVETKEIERINSVSDSAVDYLDQSRGDIQSIQAGIDQFSLAGSAAGQAKLDANQAELGRDMAAVKEILAKDAPQFLPDLADVQAKVDRYLKEGVLVAEHLASDPATRPQAAAMIASGAMGSLSAVSDEAFNHTRDKVNAWSDVYTKLGNDTMDQVTFVVIVSGVVSLLVGVCMALLCVRSIAKPLTEMTDAMRHLAAGDTNVAIPGVGQKDEVGAMAAAVQIFKEGAIERGRLEATAADARRVAESERARAESERSAAAAKQAAVVEGVAAGLEHLAEGNLVFRLETAFAPDYEKLRTDFNAAMGRLQETMVVVAASTAAIRAGSTEISTASDDLSKRTEQQAASLEETAAALDQITATVKKTADGAVQAREKVSAAKADAEHSGVVVSQAIAAMTAIETSAQQVSQIIGVIDEIAFQTNLLALNAGVEAARAGEAGRGFAVVASEVRALAQRSAEAAKEIKALISTSTGQVGEGVSLVGETGKSLQRIVRQVAEINTIVSDIAGSAHEQATGLDQVNTAVNQMDQVTQQNAAMVEESTAASHSLAQETEELARRIGRFQLGRDAGGATSGVAALRATPRPPRSSAVVQRPTGRAAAARKPDVVADAAWEEF